MHFLAGLGIRRISLKIGWINILAAIAVCNAAADSAFISSPLQPTGADANATGLVTINLTPTNSSLLLQASNLTAGATYVVVSGGVERGRFFANQNGRGQLRFVRPKSPGVPVLDFDPRGRRISLIQGGQVVLTARVSMRGEPAGSIVNEEVQIPRAPGALPGDANASYELLASGRRRFSVTLSNVADRAYTLFIDGVRRGEINVSGGVGTIGFDNAPGTPEPALNFEPRRAVVDITRGAVPRFTGKFQARAAGVNSAVPTVITRFIPPTAASPSSLARVRRWVDTDGRREVDVELVNVPPGEYQLFVNGVLRGFIPVISPEGEIQFSSDADDEDELPLSFDPFRSSYVVSGPFGVAFQGQPVAGIIDPLASTNMPSEIEVPLFNRGPDPDGTARAQLKTDDRGRRHFEVELRNVPDGIYYFLIDGIPTALIYVSEFSNGTALIELEDEPESGELPLNLDPRGRTLAIERDDELYFQRTFPAAP